MSIVLNSLLKVVNNVGRNSIKSSQNLMVMKMMSPNLPSFSVFNRFLKMSLDYFSHEQITSQNPYAEVFVGEPFVQTVNINNMKEVEEALQKILNSSVGNRC